MYINVTPFFVPLIMLVQLGCITEFCPLGTCFIDLTDRGIERVMLTLNYRNGKCLGFSSPDRYSMRS